MRLKGMGTTSTGKNYIPKNLVIGSGGTITVRNIAD